MAEMIGAGGEPVKTKSELPTEIDIVAQEGRALKDEDEMTGKSRMQESTARLTTSFLPPETAALLLKAR